MKIYIVGEENLFKKNQKEEIKKYGETIFLKKEKFIEIILNDKSEKVIIYDPDFGGWNFSTEILENSVNIKAIFLGTTDKSYIDLNYCDNKKIKVFNIPRYASDSVAEYLVMYMFNCAKKIPLQLKNNNLQDFSNYFEQMQLRNKKVGIVGYGNIGSAVANICNGIGMDVCYWDRNKKDCNYIYSSLENLFSTCDVIYLCLAINEDTKNIITDDLLNKLIENCIFISCTGKQLFNFELIEKKLINKKLFGYALEEPNRRLDSYDGNVMVTSEYAWFTKEANESRINLWISIIINYLNELNIIKSKSITKKYKN